MGRSRDTEFKKQLLVTIFLTILHKKVHTGNINSNFVIL